ncbi:MAG: 4-hydroxy-tetrahydrodipicolinate synthase [Actinobacteria bacterium]|nr:4-hydroxy-tetrahydrodipicolinate synthase [Actinomycetota bacterium]
MKIAEKLGELITAMVTPFDIENRLDLEICGKLMEHLCESCSDSILLSGTTGESPTLSDEEKIRLFEYGVKNYGDRVKIIAGTGSNDTRHSIELSREAERIGCHAILLVTPYYNRPSQWGLYKHFEAIAGEVKIPAIIYNVPTRTACNIDSKTCIELSRLHNIMGVKEASSNFRQISEIIRGCEEGFLVYSGNDGDTLPVLSLGGYGVISVASHIVGSDIKKMITAFKKGNIKEASGLHGRLLDIFYGIFIATNPIPIKEALNLMGIKAGTCRMPLGSMTEIELEAFKKILRLHNLIE